MEESKMLELILKEIREIKEELIEFKIEVDKKFKETEEKIKEDIAQDIASHTHEVMFVIKRLENKNIENQIKEHEERTVEGIEAFKKVLVR